MSLNLKNQKSTGGGNRVPQDNIEVGSYPARVVRILDLGLQAGQEFEGRMKPNAHKVDFTYELLDCFMKDKDGNFDESKPRWISEDFPLHRPDADLAKSTKRAKAIDPSNSCDYDLTKMLGMPCMVTVGHKVSKGKTYDKVLDVAPMRASQAASAPALKNEPILFLLDNPDMEVFNKLPPFMQDRIKGNLEFKGSKLEAALGGKSEETKEVPAQEEPVDNEDDSAW